MKDLIADALSKDERIVQARELIRAAMTEHRSGLTGPRPADAERKAEYEQTLADFGRNRGGNLFFPYLGSGFGNGALVELADGSVKYDFIAGIGVHFLGHDHPALLEAGLDAALSDTVMQGNLQQNRESADLVGMLLEAAGRGASRLSHCFLTTSGAMANENALKIAFHKKPGARRILAFSKCFAGRTLALSRVSDKPAFRVGLPDAIPVDYIPFLDSNRPEKSARRSMEILRRHLDRYPGEHACMVLELIQGEGGFNAGSKEFFEPIMELLRERQVAVLMDEIQTFGRTSEIFAFQHFNLEQYADIVTVGKLTQACATLYADDFKPKPGLLSQTFTAATSSIFAGRAVLRELLNGNYYGPEGKIARLNREFGDIIRDLAARFPGKIQGPYGVGAMVSFQVLDGSLEKSRGFVHDLFEAGVIAFTAGNNPTRVRFLLPAGAVDSDDLKAVAEIMAGILAKAG